MSKTMTLPEALAKLEEVSLRLHNVAENASRSFRRGMRQQCVEFDMARKVIDARFAERETIGQQVAERAIEMQKAVLAQNAQGNGEPVTTMQVDANGDVSLSIPAPIYPAGEYPLYTHAERAIPALNIMCETVSDGITGTTSLNVVRVEPQDDGSFTAVTDYWPSAQPDKEGM